MKTATAQVKPGSVEEKFSKLTPHEFLVKFTETVEKARDSMNLRVSSEEEKLMSSRPMESVKEAKEGYKHVKMTDEDRKSMDTLMGKVFKALEDRRNRTLPEGFIGGVGRNEKHMEAMENLDHRVDAAIESLNVWLYTHD